MVRSFQLLRVCLLGAALFTGCRTTINRGGVTPQFSVETSHPIGLLSQSVIEDAEDFHGSISGGSTMDEIVSSLSFLGNDSNALLTNQEFTIRAKNPANWIYFVGDGGFSSTAVERVPDSTNVKIKVIYWVYEDPMWPPASSAHVRIEYVFAREPGAWRKVSRVVKRSLGVDDRSYPQDSFLRREKGN
jgi:hypothetical protein